MDSGNAALTVMDFFRIGGIFMWPLLFFSVCAVCIAIKKTIYMMTHNLRMVDLEETTGQYIMARNLNGAVQYLSGLQKHRMGARMLLTMVRNAGCSIHRIEKTFEAETANCISDLEKGLNFLVAIGFLAPLTGFLGTVSRMIGAFISIAQVSEVNAKIAASGIYEALVTTVFGLIIAIIAVTAYYLLSHAVNRFAAAAARAGAALITELEIMKNETEQSGGGAPADGA